MKKLKRIFSLMIAVVMVLAMNVTAFAASGDLTITIDNEKTGHTYAAYQVFSGDLSGNVLSNIVWGDGVGTNAASLLEALKVDPTIGSNFTNCNTAADVAKVLSDAEGEGETFESNSANMDTFAAIVGRHLTDQTSGTSQYHDTNKNYTISGLAPGYYLIKDANVVTGEDFSTDFILKLTNNTSVAPKGNVPSVEKKVQENDKYKQNGGYGTGYNDVADWNIGDNVPFKLIGTLPSNYEDYSTYKYVFHDTLSNGLTLNYDAENPNDPEKSSIHVYYASDKEGTDKTVIDPSDYNITTPGTETETKCSFEIAFSDLKKVSGVSANSYIIVEYTAELNTNAEIGLPGNPNDVYLEFSNNPNAGGEGDTGETTKDTVIVFTYELDVTKVDGANENTKLANAQFVFLNTDKTQVASVDSNGKFAGWIALTAIDTNKDSTYTAAEFAAYDESNTNKVILTSDAEGEFGVSGIDDGTYYLREIVAPSGYNLLPGDVQLVITATTSNGQDYMENDFHDTPGEMLTALNLSVTIGSSTSAGTGDASTGIVSTEVQNNQGATLPETGGIGTRIFYAVGAVLMIGAAVILITRKRSAK